MIRLEKLGFDLGTLNNWISTIPLNPLPPISPPSQPSLRHARRLSLRKQVVSLGQSHLGALSGESAFGVFEVEVQYFLHYLNRHDILSGVDGVEAIAEEVVAV